MRWQPGNLVLIIAFTFSAPMSALAAEIPLPSPHVGNIYQFRTGDAEFTRTVTEVDPDGTILFHLEGRSSKSSYSYDQKDTNNLNVFNAQSYSNGNTYDYTFTPPACYMPQAPWTIGKEWSCFYSSMGRGKYTHSIQFVLKGKLEDIEKVTVPAGTFDAVRVTIDSGSRRTYWYSSKVQYFVKEDTGNPETSFELVKYELK